MLQLVSCAVASGLHERGAHAERHGPADVLPHVVTDHHGMLGCNVPVYRTQSHNECISHNGGRARTTTHMSLSASWKKSGHGLLYRHASRHNNNSLTQTTSLGE